ncbi:MAG TPA: toluene monooxygenase, partial [Polyangia bacterium]
MLKRAQWFDLARHLDWQPSYVSEKEAFPDVPAGQPWLPREEWSAWDEPFRTTYAEYVATQHEKESALFAVQEAAGRPDDFRQLPREWLSAVKLHTATLPLAEFAAVIGNLRAAR